MVAAEGGVRHGHGFAWEPPPLEAFEVMHRHFLGTGPQRVWVAEDERIRAFAAVVDARRARGSSPTSSSSRASRGAASARNFSGAYGKGDGDRSGG